MTGTQETLYLYVFGPWGTHCLLFLRDRTAIYKKIRAGPQVQTGTIIQHSIFRNL